MSETQSRTELLDSIFNNIPENDWLDGLDMYQDGNVQSVNELGGLITARIEGHRLTNEVRIKIHPAGHCIQWIECTCRKNRISGRYCEHIAAAMLHIDRERKDLVSKLDQKMPLKPPSVGRTRSSNTETKSAISKTSRATDHIISHLKGAIHGVSLVSGGPNIRIELEIKEGLLTNYNLGIDDAPDFLRQQATNTKSFKEVRNIQVLDSECERVFVVMKGQGDDVQITKAILLPDQISADRRRVKEKQKMSKFKSGVLICHNRGKTVISDRQLLPVKENRKLIGKKFAFVQHVGYVPIDESNYFSSWDEMPESSTLKGDQVPEAVRSGFETFLKHAPVLIEESLANDNVITVPNIGTINVQQQLNGWFNLDPRYESADNAISMVDLLKSYRKTQQKFVKTGKHWIEVPDYIREIDWQVSDDGQSMKVNALGLLRLQAMVGDFDRFVGSKTVLDAVRTQTDPDTPSLPPDLSETNLQLRQYQRDGYSWLWWLYSSGLHGLLADEMGLGKTHQAMALLAAIRQVKPKASLLVICPTTVLDHWIDKVVTFCPSLNPVKYHGPKRLNDVDLSPKSTVTLVTSYGVVLRDTKIFQSIQWGAIILDEAHAIKNSDTATYKAVCQMHSDIRVAMSGTPMENHLSELKNVFDFLVPGYLGSDSYFRKNFIRAMEDRDPESEVLLQRLLHPLKLRRTKEQVLSDLPEKVEDRRRIELSDEQAAIYRDIIRMKAQPILEKLKDESSAVPYLHVFAILTMLKQVCDHPALVLKTADHDAHESSKFELLKELLEEALGSGHKVVIFSQYVEMISIIDRYLTKSDIEHVVLTGQSRNRGALISRFQTDENCKVFVGSLLAGGTGIDLTAASVVIHYDRWWNASKENQATDRVHRIGQTKNVQVLKLICAGTLEEKIDRMIESKRDLFERFLDRDEEMFKHLSRKELIELLA